MNWDAIAAIGQMLGSLAVLVTLGYLAVQVGHARLEMRRSIFQGTRDALREMSMNSANNARLNGLQARAHTALGAEPSQFQAALMTRAGMTLEETFALSANFLAYWQVHLSLIQYRNEHSEDERAGFEAVIRSFYKTNPLSRLWYETTKANLHPMGIRYIDSLLAQPG